MFLKWISEILYYEKNNNIIKNWLILIKINPKLNNYKKNLKLLNNSNSNWNIIFYCGNKFWKIIEIKRLYYSNNFQQ